MASHGWLTAPQESAWRRYRRMRTLLDLQIARDLSNDSGLSETDYDVLSTLSENPDGRWRARDLAARLLWSTSRLAHHVGRMEQRGLVARQPCPGDARGALISLTSHGRATLEQAAPPHVASVRRHMIDLLTPGEIAALDTIAAKVISHLTRQVSRKELPPLVARVAAAVLAEEAPSSAGSTTRTSVTAGQPRRHEDPQRRSQGGGLIQPH